MKRMATLFLACALLFTSAHGFRDDADIGAAYHKAVDAMVESGVLAGYDDGAYHPNDILTREQGAKIVAYLHLGKDAAERLRCDKAPFDDVDKAHWSAPCIAWCAENGILHGYGNGKFGPTDTLTGDQFAKMLLCALGLSRKGNYANIGATWYQAVREDARKAKLYDGDAAMESDKAINRAQAALLGWNSLQTAEQKAGASTSSASGGSSGGGNELPLVPHISG